MDHDRRSFLTRVVQFVFGAFAFLVGRGSRSAPPTRTLDVTLWSGGDPDVAALYKTFLNRTSSVPLRIKTKLLDPCRNVRERRQQLLTEWQSCHAGSVRRGVTPDQWLESRLAQDAKLRG